MQPDAESDQRCQEGDSKMPEPNDPDKLQPAQEVDSDAPNGEQGETPLMEAARWGRVDAVRGLIESGADVNLKTQEAWTALHAACVGKHGTIIELLLTHNANPNIYSYHRHFDEQLGWHFAGTPLHVAAANGSVQVAELLLAGGALVSEAWDADWRTPIFYAAAYGHAEMIALLCKHDANPNCREHSHENNLFFDNTPLHYAARNGHVEALKVLLSCRAEPRAVESYSGHTALQMARASKHQDVVKVLREQKK
jgi:ankyrin repeat protein